MSYAFTVGVAMVVSGIIDEGPSGVIGALVLFTTACLYIGKTYL